jgi:DNA-binding NarL/FixJ family response regulator
MEPIKILIIHDDLSERDPIVVTLQEIYGKENVLLEKRSSEGLKYIHNHLASKLIVLLDFDLGPGEPHAPEVIEKIREETSLVYVIIITAKLLSDISKESLMSFINNDALAMLPATGDTDEILKHVEKAAHSLDTRVDCVLEQWIAKRPKNLREKPYLTTRSGVTYTLDDLIVEIRKETDIGQRLEKGILQLAIEQLTNGDEKLND